MIEKPLLILDPHFRTIDELFSEDDFRELNQLCRVVGNFERSMTRAEIDGLIEQASFLVAARPSLTTAQIKNAGHLKAVIEVSGAFHQELDYSTCFSQGIEVLSCSPGFRQSVAEMTLALMLASARGVVQEHEAFRIGKERWFDDRASTDFSLFGQRIGFVGYGEIARATHRLLLPFSPTVIAYDPWLSADLSPVPLYSLESLVQQSRVVVVTAAPTADNQHLLGADLIKQFQPGSLLVLISRAHCVDFPALLSAAASGRIRVATDVFPHEPTPATDPLRQHPNMILSPHRAAAVAGGRQLIGQMIVNDVTGLLAGTSERQLSQANPDRVAALVAAQQSIEAEQTTR